MSTTTKTLTVATVLFFAANAQASYPSNELSSENGKVVDVAEELATGKTLPDALGVLMTKMSEDEEKSTTGEYFGSPWNRGPISGTPVIYPHQ